MIQEIQGGRLFRPVHQIEPAPVLEVSEAPPHNLQPRMTGDQSGVALVSNESPDDGPVLLLDPSLVVFPVWT